MTGWRFVSWNVDHRQRNPQQVPRLEYLARLGSTVAALQEVPGSVGRAVASEWGDRAVLAQQLHEDRSWRYIGSALLFTDGTAVLDAGLIPGLPQARRGLWARVRLPGGLEVSVASWHAPNTYGHGIAGKALAFESVTEWARRAPRPVVLGADLNTWRDPVDLTPPVRGEKHEAEHAFVGPDPQHGLVDAHRTVLQARGEMDRLRADRPNGPLDVSYELSNGVGHRMDRIFASPELRPQDGGYRSLEEARAAGSDHALHWVDFA